MHVKVLFFGMLKDVVGRAAEVLELGPGCDIAVLFDHYVERFPELEQHRDSLLFSRNREFVSRNHLLHEGDEVALLPPVSGGSPVAGGASPVAERAKVIARLTSEPIEAASLVRELQRPEDGAVVVFEGVVRNHTKGKATLFLEYEAYEPMAIEKMREIGEQLLREYPIDQVGLVHRLGRLEIGEASVVIVTTSAHRKAAFEASREAIDRLKRIVPIWKKEHFADGAVWVEGEGSPMSHSAL